MNGELIDNGVLGEFKDSSIVFHKKEFVEMDLELGVDRLQKIELRKKNREREGTLMGAFIGLVGGGIIGLATNDTDCDFFCFSSETIFLLYGGPAMVVGGIIGNKQGNKRLQVTLSGNIDNYLGFKASIRIKPKRTPPPLVDYW
jgi:hypothetical protein